jgi:hypothetical protein
MAGRGQQPKDPRVRARKNTDPIPQQKITGNWRAEPQPMPSDLLPEGDDWHPATVRMWDRMVSSPLSENWTETEWSELEVLAVLHHEFMRKRSFTLASELRLRGAKFGVTPEDKARLRIVLVDADEKDNKRAPKPAANAWGDLRALPNTGA